MYAFDKLSVITLPLLLRAEIPNVSCFWDHIFPEWLVVS